MKQFNTFEEIDKNFPLNNKTNLRFLVHQCYSFALTQKDLELLKKDYPLGYYNKEEHKWYYWHIDSNVWYDCYIYNGEEWILGIDTWDGIIYAEEPTWGIQYTQTVRKSEFGVFRTIEEAEEYRNRKIKEKFDF